MSTFTLPSGQGHHFKERAFRNSFLFSIVVHVAILIAAGSFTLFRMSGNHYSPSYTVDLVSLPAPAPAKKAAPVVKPAPEVVEKPKPKPEPKPKPAPAKVEAKPAVAPPPETAQKTKSAGGDEAARLERRKKIEELELEARRLYESFTSESDKPPAEAVPQTETVDEGPPVASAPAGGNDKPANIRFRAYYDRVWSKIRSSWVLPEGVTSRASLVTVVGIRIAPNGEIEQFWIEEGSGNDYYDQSAIRAIRKANPLPPLPDELSDAPLEVGINFKYPDKGAGGSR